MFKSSSIFFKSLQTGRLEFNFKLIVCTTGQKLCAPAFPPNRSPSDAALPGCQSSKGTSCSTLLGCLGSSLDHNHPARE
ncbi:hypothetical protein Acr_08g0016640 [Actinidia rufa]|uniref:Uncharacterized protein n=1 Tax=Actinidia rufa TaxID=165716 RepID=A0A7J0F3J7_9ERIC|nr:hypothetical protein Acr_08g0016640 [Actinidia rufa]